MYVCMYVYMYVIWILWNILIILSTVISFKSTLVLI